MPRSSTVWIVIIGFILVGLVLWKMYLPKYTPAKIVEQVTNTVGITQDASCAQEIDHPPTRSVKWVVTDAAKRQCRPVLDPSSESFAFDTEEECIASTRGHEGGGWILTNPVTQTCMPYNPKHVPTDRPFSYKIYPTLADCKAAAKSGDHTEPSAPFMGYADMTSDSFASLDLTNFASNPPDRVSVVGNQHITPGLAGQGYSLL